MKPKSMTNKRDPRITAAVLVCLGVGAGLTYWLANAGSEPEARQPVQHGRPLNAPRESTATIGPATNSSKAPETTNTEGGTYKAAGFDILTSFYYPTPNLDAPATDLLGETQKNQIPTPIKDLDGKKVSVQGFMMHVKGANGECKIFMLVRDMSICCYGRIPRMNERITVTMKGDKTTPLIINQAVTVFGTLSVGEQIENGTLKSIYRLEADDVAGPLNL